jgi:hypothetical protein
MSVPSMPRALSMKLQPPADDSSGDLNAAAYRQARVLYDSCVRHAPAVAPPSPRTLRRIRGGGAR